MLVYTDVAVGVLHDDGIPPVIGPIGEDDVSVADGTHPGTLGDGQIYNVSDGTPGTMTDYFNRVADIKGLKRPPVIDREQSRQELPATMLSYLQESRRIDNGKMLKEFELELRYPTLDKGLPASL